MTSQELVTSKSHNSQDHHGDLRSRLQRARDARLPRGWAVSFPFPVFLYFFFKKFQFPFLASLRFLFVSATLTYSWQPTGVACRSASEVAPLLESSKPWVAHRSRRWRTRRIGRRRRRKKKGSACFERERERERERETKQTKAGCSCQSHVALPVSLTSRRAGIHAHEWKKKLRLRYLLSDSTSHVSLSFLVNWQDVITVCMTVSLDGNGNSWLDLRCWDWTRTFPQRVDNRLASNRKDQVTECLFEQLLLRFKRKVGWRRQTWSLMQGRFPYFIHEFEPRRTIRTASCRHGVFSYCPPNEPWHPSSFLKSQT